MALYINKRRSGNTTRIVDELIQNLFFNGEIICYDHKNGGRYAKGVMKTIIHRLTIEVGLNAKLLEIDEKKYSIKLKNK